MHRRAVVVRGIVQGVGFRPFVHQLATGLHLTGMVRNQSGSVLIEVEGPEEALDQFLSRLTADAPPLAHIEDIHCTDCPVVGEPSFQIVHSEHSSSGVVLISPDAATCDDCLTELFDSQDRRYRYPFLNCAHCGPRLTIIRSAPYDRERTAMASFPMCDRCREEYEDIQDRRFHAQPVACPACGPKLELVGQDGDPLQATVDALLAEKIVAIKGLGGFHLACAADSDTAVSLLRGRKERDEKPFAIMVSHIDIARHYCEVSTLEADLLISTARPIVLLRKRVVDGIAEGVAPGNPWLGVMLPYTPLHHLLLRALAGVPLVMTSGNRSDEPIVYRDGEIDRLSGIADLYLTHNRPIHLRCDDSVTRVIAGQEMPLRRSRGYAPQPVTLPMTAPFPIMATGGQLKSTFAMAQDRFAVLSHHLGDLDHLQAYQAWVESVAHYRGLFEIEPQLIVHDLHPDYHTTRYAVDQAIPLLGVQHHHAHMASCMAEHGLTDPVIGIIFDGTGYGLDGTIWGGEALVGDYQSMQRMACFRPVPMPGGEAAIREPWRMALSYLIDAELSSDILMSVPVAKRQFLEQMIAKQVSCPLTSSAGRLFDGIAALIGLRDQVSYEGQAAIELEWLADSEQVKSYPWEMTTESQPALIDTRPLIRAVVRDIHSGRSRGQISGRFHTTMVEILTDLCLWLKEQTGISDVVFSGGVFMNAILAGGAVKLQEQGFRAYLHRQVPANDGGLSLGQLAIAVAVGGSKQLYEELDA